MCAYNEQITVTIMLITVCAGSLRQITHNPPSKPDYPQDHLFVQVIEKVTC